MSFETTDISANNNINNKEKSEIFDNINVNQKVCGDDYCEYKNNDVDVITDEINQSITVELPVSETEILTKYDTPSEVESTFGSPKSKRRKLQSFDELLKKWNYNELLRIFARLLKFLKSSDKKFLSFPFALKEHEEFFEMIVQDVTILKSKSLDTDYRVICDEIIVAASGYSLSYDYIHGQRFKKRVIVITKEHRMYQSDNASFSCSTDSILPSSQTGSQVDNSEEMNRSPSPGPISSSFKIDCLRTALAFVKNDVTKTKEFPDLNSEQAQFMHLLLESIIAFTEFDSNLEMKELYRALWEAVRIYSLKFQFTVKSEENCSGKNSLVFEKVPKVKPCVTAVNSNQKMNSKTVASKLETPEPEIPEPGASKTNALKPKTTIPETLKTGAPIPEALKIGAPILEASKTGALIPDASKTEAPILEALKTEALPDASKTETTIPDASKTEATIPDASKTESPIPEASKTEAPIPEVSKTKSPIPDALKTAAPIPEASKTAAPIPEASKTKDPIPKASKTAAPIPDASKTAAPIPEASKTKDPIPKASKTAAPIPDASKTAAPIPDASKTQDPIPEASKTEAPIPKASKRAAPIPDASKTESPIPDTSLTAAPIPEASKTEAPILKASKRAAPIPDASKTESPIPDTSLTAAPIPKASKTAAPIPDASKIAAPIPETSKTKDPIPKASKTAAPIPDASKTAASIPEASKTEAPIPEASKTEAPIPEASKTEAPIPEASKTEAPIPEASKTEDPMPEASKIESVVTKRMQKTRLRFESESRLIKKLSPQFISDTLNSILDFLLDEERTELLLLPNTQIELDFYLGCLRWCRAYSGVSKFSLAFQEIHHQIAELLIDVKCTVIQSCQINEKTRLKTVSYMKSRPVLTVVTITDTAQSIPKKKKVNLQNALQLASTNNIKLESVINLNQSLRSKKKTKKLKKAKLKALANANASKDTSATSTNQDDSWPFWADSPSITGINPGTSTDTSTMVAQTQHVANLPKKKKVNLQNALQLASTNNIKLESVINLNQSLRSKKKTKKLKKAKLKALAKANASKDTSAKPTNQDDSWALGAVSSSSTGINPGTSTDTSTITAQTQQVANKDTSATPTNQDDSWALWADSPSITGTNPGTSTDTSTLTAQTQHVANMDTSTTPTNQDNSWAQPLRVVEDSAKPETLLQQDLEYLRSRRKNKYKISSSMNETYQSAADFVQEMLRAKREGMTRKEKRMDALSAVPVYSDKAMKMMFGMGWNGGALGVRGNGITEPLMPIRGITKRSGFGHINVKTDIILKKPKDSKAAPVFVSETAIVTMESDKTENDMIVEETNELPVENPTFDSLPNAIEAEIPTKSNVELPTPAKSNVELPETTKSNVELPKTTQPAVDLEKQSIELPQQTKPLPSQTKTTVELPKPIKANVEPPEPITFKDTFNLPLKSYFHRHIMESILEFLNSDEKIKTLKYENALSKKQRNFLVKAVNAIKTRRNIIYFIVQKELFDICKQIEVKYKELDQIILKATISIDFKSVELKKEVPDESETQQDTSQLKLSVDAEIISPEKLYTYIASTGTHLDSPNAYEALKFKVLFLFNVLSFVQSIHEEVEVNFNKVLNEKQKNYIGNVIDEVNMRINFGSSPAETNLCAEIKKHVKDAFLTFMLNHKHKAVTLIKYFRRNSRNKPDSAIKRKCQTTVNLDTFSSETKLNTSAPNVKENTNSTVAEDNNVVGLSEEPQGKEFASIVISSDEGNSDVFTEPKIPSGEEGINISSSANLDEEMPNIVGINNSNINTDSASKNDSKETENRNKNNIGNGNIIIDNNDNQVIDMKRDGGHTTNAEKNMVDTEIAEYLVHVDSTAEIVNSEEITVDVNKENQTNISRNKKDGDLIDQPIKHSDIVGANDDVKTVNEHKDIGIENIDKMIDAIIVNTEDKIDQIDKAVEDSDCNDFTEMPVADEIQSGDDPSKNEKDIKEDTDVIIKEIDDEPMEDISITEDANNVFDETKSSKDEEVPNIEEENSIKSSTDQIVERDLKVKTDGDIISTEKLVLSEDVCDTHLVMPSHLKTDGAVTDVPNFHIKKDTEIKNMHIAHINHPIKKFTNVNVKDILTHISNSILWTSELPELKWHGVRNGVLFYSCHNKKSYDWLENIIKASFAKVLNTEEVTKMALKFYNFRDFDTKYLFKMIELYNQGLSTKEWEVDKTEKDGDFVIFYVKMDKLSIKFILESNLALFAGIDEVQFSPIWE